MDIIFKILEYTSIGLSAIILAIGIWCFLNWIFWEWMVKPAMIYFKAYDAFVNYLFHRKEFKEYMELKK